MFRRSLFVSILSLVLSLSLSGVAAASELCVDVPVLGWRQCFPLNSPDPGP